MAIWSCVTMDENMSSVAELLFYRNFSDSNLIQIGKSTNLWDWSKGKVKH